MARRGASLLPRAAVSLKAEASEGDAENDAQSGRVDFISVVTHLTAKRGRRKRLVTSPLLDKKVTGTRRRIIFDQPRPAIRARVGAPPFRESTALQPILLLRSVSEGPRARQKSPREIGIQHEKGLEQRRRAAAARRFDCGRGGAAAADYLSDCGHRGPGGRGGGGRI